MTVTREQFIPTYEQATREMLERMPGDWSALARHNPGWNKERFDAKSYLETSSIRYWHATRLLAKAGARAVLDAGGFLGAFPLTLKRLGYDVAIAEKYGYYGNAMDHIAEHLQANGVRVIDTDISGPGGADNTMTGRFDAVTCMAVAEHLPHSPRTLIKNIRTALRSGGFLVFEVPNVAYWPKRYAFFFRGETVHAPIEDVYHSEMPFTGHHREYTLEDARYVVKQGQFEVEDELTFNYTISRNRPLQVVKYLPAFLLKGWAEVIMLGCRKSARGAG